MQADLGRVRDRIVFCGQQCFDNLRDMAAQKDVTEREVRCYQPGLLCDSQGVSEWGLSRWQFWKQRLHQIRDEQLGGLDLIEDEAVPLINETIDRMNAIEREAGPIEGDNWPKLSNPEVEGVEKEGKKKLDGNEKRLDEKKVRFEEGRQADGTAVNGGWLFSCVVS